MDNSSSSSSALEEASMDDSEHENEYDYDLDDGEDDAHDDYEDIAEEEEEEDDDDEYEEHANPLLMDLTATLPPHADFRMHQMRPSNHENIFSSRLGISPRQMFLQLQEVYGQQDSIITAHPAHHHFHHHHADHSHHHGSGGAIHPPVVIPTRGMGVIGIGHGPIPTPGDSAANGVDQIRSFILENFEPVPHRHVGSPIGDPSRLMESFRISTDGRSFLPSRIFRHASIPLLTPHRIRPSPNSEPPTSTHPHLAPTNPAFVINPTNSFDWFSPTGRRSAHIVPPAEQRSASHLPAASSSLASLNSGSSFHSTDSVNGYEGALFPHARALDAIHRVSSIMSEPQSRLGKQEEESRSQEPQASSSHVPVDFVSSYVPRTSNGESLQPLLDGDLMRTVALASRSEGPLEALARARSTMDHRSSHRDPERVRDKVPSAVARRWRYEPVVSSGDVLPALFDSEMGRRHSRSIVSPSPNSNPADIPKPLNHAATKVGTTVENMILQIASINERIRSAEKKIEEEKKKLELAKKKEEEERLQKEKAEKGKEAEESKQTMADDETMQTSVPVVQSSEEGQGTERRDDPSLSPSVVAAAIETGLGVSSASGHEEQLEDENRTDEDQRQPQTGDANANADDSMMDTDETEQPPSTSETPANASNEQTTAEGESASAPTSAPSTGNQFSAVATQRAAAAGISLDAPANENPEVVAAATQSTGIDPAFLAALPADVREEILTEYYESICTNNNNQNGTSSSPPSTSVNQDFLIALPPSLRAEVLELEADFQARRNRNNTNNNNNNNTNGTSSGQGANDNSGNNQNNSNNVNSGANDTSNTGDASAGGADMDTATFLATLPPELREDILLTSGETFIESLPPNVAAEARVLREREMQSRLPWRVARDPFSGVEGREFGSGRPTSNSRHRERSTPNEAPAYKWKKVGSGWLREKPNPACEPNACLKPDGISALVGLLWNHNGGYEKTILYQVLSHLCKTTDLRYVILDKLVSLITSKAEDSNMLKGGTSSLIKGSNSKDSIYPERIRFHGTVVRRGLDLLTMLSKHDTLVSETLLGLPKTEEEIKSIGEISLNEHSHQELLYNEREETHRNLSTLMGLLKDRLFSRSASHLEQLVLIISIVSQAIPPQDVSAHEKSRNRRLMRNRSLLVRHGHIGEPMNVVYGIGDEDEGLVYRATEDEEIMGPEDLIQEAESFLSRGNSRGAGRSSSDIGTDSGNNDNDTGNNGEGENAQGSNSNSGEGDQQGRNNGSKRNGKEKVKPEKPVVPVKFRIPILQTSNLVSLTEVLLREGCSEKTYERVSRAIGLLGELPNNRVVFMRSLMSIAQNSGRSIWYEYEKCLNKVGKEALSLNNQKNKAGSTGIIDSKFILGSAKNELTLLRVVKSLATLLKHNAIQNRTMKSKSTNDNMLLSTEDSFRENVVTGLRELWAGLDQLLEKVSDDVKSGGKKDQIDSTKSIPVTTSIRGSHRSRSNSSRAANAVLNGERLKVGSGGLSPSLARLSPMIEAFLVTHCSEEEAEELASKAESKDKKSKSTSTNDSPSNTSGRASSSSIVSSPLASGRVSSSSVDRSNAGVGSKQSASRDSVVDENRTLDERVALFVERHRIAINSLLRANSGLLERSFKGVLRHSHAIDFDNKKAYFRNVLRKRFSEAHARPIRINVRRDRVFDDSYQQLRMRTPNEMKGRLHVQFVGEEGVDAGGVTREWYTILARQIFDPNYVLFTRSAAKAATYQPDKRSFIHREHLDNFKFVGRVIGKAIYDGQLLDAYFTRSFYKHILGLKPTYHDIEAQDPEYYKSLKWMLENEITGILDYTMSAEYDEFGKQTIVDLLPNGRNVPVTEENKAEYVKLVTEVRMSKTIEKQIEAFKEGFYELIPFEDCKIFNELELELLMSGLPDIDVSDLKANVEYTGYTASSPQINWFWKCVSTMDQEDLARLVMFVTGTSKVPLEGFAQLQGMNGVHKFQIHRVGGNTMRLPSAHTCFNQLDLPEYSSSETLSERLLRAVRECSVGFGFA